MRTDSTPLACMTSNSWASWPSVRSSRTPSAMTPKKPWGTTRGAAGAGEAEARTDMRLTSSVRTGRAKDRVPRMDSRRVALVHDFLLDVRGAERVFAAICDLYPEADLFTAVYDEMGTDGRFRHRRIHTSFLQRTRPDARTFRALLPLYPYAMEALDLRGYDLVISSSSAWAHGVIADADAVHLCYCHNPFRYAWNAREATLAKYDPLRRAVLGFVFQRWRQWDWIAAQRVDLYEANSDTTRRRVER